MPEQAKQKTAKRRGRKPKSAKPATGKGAGKPGSVNAKHKRGRKYTDPKIRERRLIVRRLYYIRKWPPQAILKHLKAAGHDIRHSQLHNDICSIKKEFLDAKKNGEGGLDDILHEITAGKNERVQMLWNELAKIEEADKLLVERQNTLNSKLDTPGADLEPILKGLDDCEKQLSFSLAKKLKTIKELREHDDSFVESVRKLGITVDIDEDSEDEVLIRIRARRKERDEKSINITIGDADGGSGEK
jgi:septal ring factor EnvC (AmiA/AmiB activator)